MIEESLALTIFVKWSIMYYCEALISIFRLIFYSHFLCQQTLVFTYVSILKYSKYPLITLRPSLFSLNLLEKIKSWDWLIGQEDIEQKLLLQGVCQNISLPYPQTHYEYTHPLPLSWENLVPSRHLGLARGVQFSSRPVSSHLVL